MKAIVTLTPRIVLEIEEQDEMETLSKALVLASYPKKCSLCGEKAIGLTSNKDKEGNIYVNVVCFKCGGKAKLGRYKTSGYFWHRDFVKYEPKNEQK